MWAIQLQVAAYLVKPFEVQLLLTGVRNAIVRARAAKIARKIQKHWQERAAEVQEVAASKPSATWTSDFSIELLLAMVLDDLSQSFSDIQDLRTLFDYRGGKPLASSVLCPPSYPTTEGYPQPDNAKSSMLLQLRKQKEHSQEKIHPAHVLAQIQQLSRRERDVLRLLLTNKKPKTIAGTLFISAHTVRNHLRSIFDKFSVHSQTELLTVLGKYLTYADLQDAV
jgi:DNA-binding CsgD family transcriptional regulator